MFWRQTKSKNKAGSYTINGAKNKIDIANGFMKHFAEILTDKNDYSESDFQKKTIDNFNSISSNVQDFEPKKDHKGAKQ